MESRSSPRHQENVKLARRPLQTAQQRRQVRIDITTSPMPTLQEILPCGDRPTTDQSLPHSPYRSTPSPMKMSRWSSCPPTERRKTEPISASSMSLPFLPFLSLILVRYYLTFLFSCSNPRHRFYPSSFIDLHSKDVSP